LLVTGSTRKSTITPGFGFKLLPANEYEFTCRFVEGTSIVRLRQCDINLPFEIVKDYQDFDPQSFYLYSARLCSLAGNVKKALIEFTHRKTVGGSVYSRRLNPVYPHFCDGVKG
jgi:hypothetical protein